VDFNGPAKLDQSDQGYNDRAKQVMVDVRKWHEADDPLRSDQGSY
jgi:hypothetical protein